MNEIPHELTELVLFRAAPEGRRRDIGRAVAAGLGDGWAFDGLIGDAGLCALRHAGLGVRFAVVPGGSFEMGLRDDDLAAIARLMDARHPFVEAFVARCERTARPTRAVTVGPHLFAVTLLTRDEVERIEPLRGTDEVDRAAALSLSRRAGFRLPSEAEYEWVAREGGALTFTCDAARRLDDGALADTRLANGFGVEALLWSQWVADDPHDDYAGAPTTSAAWCDPATSPPSLEAVRRGDDGVRRGAVEDGVEDATSLLYCLAALRSGGDMVFLRLARDL